MLHCLKSCDNIYFNGNFGGSNYFNPCITSACDLIIGLSNGGTCDAVLPVELIDFAVKAEKQGFIIEWATATEIDNKGFYVQMKKEGQEYFEDIDFIEGKGNSVNQNEYAYFYESDFDGGLYFRLVQEDFDGSLTYAPVRFAKLLIEQETKVFPNPVTQQEIKIKTNSIGANINIYDLSGKLVFNSEIVESLSSFSLPNLEAGYYIAEVIGSSEVFSTKILIQ